MAYISMSMNQYTFFGDHLALESFELCLAFRSESVERDGREYGVREPDQKQGQRQGGFHGCRG